MARRARKWGCSTPPCTWLGSSEHLATAVLMEKEIEKKGAKPEAFDFYILYYAWITTEDEKIKQELCNVGKVPPLKRAAMGDDDASGELSVGAKTGKRMRRENGGDVGGLGADRVLRERTKRKRVTIESSSGEDEDEDEGFHNSKKKRASRRRDNQYD